MKRIVTLLLAFAVVLSFAGCDKKSGDKLVVWTFSDEVKGMIENHYLKDNSDLPYEVDVVVIPNQFGQKLDPALTSGQSAPDVFALEAGEVKKYVDSDYTADLSKVGIDNTSVKTIPYVLNVGSDQSGVLKGMSWQATPGAFFYRRSLAEKYLGVSEPEDVQALVSNFDEFYETAKKINNGSNGKTKMVSSLSDFIQVFLATREQGWIVDNKFVVDPQIDALLSIAYLFEQEDLTNNAELWTESWFASMSGDDVFGYFLPTWGLHYVLKSNAVNAETGESTEGDWGMIQGPSSYFWGGTWLAMRQGTSMEEAAGDLIKYLTLNEDFLTAWAKETGDFVSHQGVIDNIKTSYSEPFLAGQNHYNEFAEMVKGIDASIMTGSDVDVNRYLEEQIKAYSKGEKDKETAIKDFIASVQNAFPNLDYLD